jgi:hypothetical protein
VRPPLAGRESVADSRRGNILPDSTAAPALQAHQRELEKHMRADSLEKQLQARPKPADLVREGILEGVLLYGIWQS